MSPQPSYTFKKLRLSAVKVSQRCMFFSTQLTVWTLLLATQAYAQDAKNPQETKTTAYTQTTAPSYTEKASSDSKLSPHEVKADVTETVTHIAPIKDGELEAILPPTSDLKWLPQLPIYGQSIGKPELLAKNVVRIVAIQDPATLFKSDSHITTNNHLQQLTILDGYGTLIQTSSSEKATPEDSTGNDNSNDIASKQVPRLISSAQWLQNVQAIYLIPNTASAEKALLSFKMMLQNHSKEKIESFANEQHWLKLKIQRLNSSMNLAELQLQNSSHPIDITEKTCISPDFSNYEKLASSNQLTQLSYICGNGYQIANTPPNLNNQFYSFSPQLKNQQIIVSVMPQLDSLGYYYQTKGCSSNGAPLIDARKNTIKAICARPSFTDPALTLAISYQSIQHFTQQ